MKIRLAFYALAALAPHFAMAGAFTNGSFEDGTSAGWITGEAFRGNTPNSSLTTADILPGGALYNGPAASRSTVISAGTLDPLLGSLLGSTVYSGQYAYRAEDTINGGFASAISQKVVGYTDPNIFFAWKAVLENGGHIEDQSAEMLITLTDDTTGTLLVSRVYNAGDGGGGVDTRFQQSGTVFYTSTWQIEQLAIDPALQGHDFTLSLLAADCQPTGHVGYVYLDGFGAAIDPAALPEPGSLSLFGIGALGYCISKRKRASVTRLPRPGADQS